MAKNEVIRRTVTLKGLTDIMFDRYAGDNKTKLDNWKKLNFAPGTKNIVLPTTNLMSFLSSVNTESAPARVVGGKGWKSIAKACLSYVGIEGTHIPFQRNGQPITLGTPTGDMDTQSGCYIHTAVARLAKGVPNPKERPVLPMDWSLKFNLQIFPNSELREEVLQDLFEKGGVAIGLGTYRGIYGKFAVEKWE